MSWIYPHLVKEALAELADTSYQRRVWLASAGPVVGSFDEAVCQLYDDSGLGDALERGSGRVFSAEIDEALTALGAQLQWFTDRTLHPEEILADKRFEDIRGSSGQILFAIVRWEAESSRSSGT